MSNGSYEGPERIAVVGMACRFPGAADVEAFWRNLRDGVESITAFTPEELLEAGTDPALLRNPEFVPAGAPIEGVDLFDADFFDLAPREAELMDPQHRLFLEHAWQALEHAGVDPDTFPGLVGVFAGSGMNTYLLNLVARGGAGGSEALQNRIRNDKDFLATLASYKLNLRGPSLSVQTACSTSLVAVHLACQSLLDFHCDAALAGGVSAGAPLRSGYLPREGVFSPDGHCRPFDARGEGTVGGSGVGVVVLKRLSDALNDGDHVHAVILGSAVNNDGAAKVGYSAPGVDGQVEVVAMAHAVADVAPETVTYVEAHGTATPMGDPVEVAALTRAFATGERRFCALGSVKGNVGHLDAAAGVASLIKAVLAVEHGEIPPTLHFTEPNPRIDFANSPFFVADRLLPWVPAEAPRRAGVSSFGVGGTNAHMVLEEAPAPPAAPPTEGEPELLVLSARTPEALERLAADTAEHLERHPDVAIADVAFTLQRGRRAFPHRRAVVAATAAEAAALLRGSDAARAPLLSASDTDPGVAFLFSGLGTQYAGMGRGLYEHEPAFRRAMDRCFAILRDGWGMDLRSALHGGAAQAPAGSGVDLRALLRGGAGPGDDPLAGARLGHPAMFSVGWALAETWRERGIEPRAVAGHSLGEYVAACVAGVFTLEDALTLVVRRAELLAPIEGSMAAATLFEPETRELVEELAGAGHPLWLAAVNAPRSCVVSGGAEAVAAFGERARARGAVVLPLAVRHPFHSGLLEPLREPFRHAVAAVRRAAPEIPLATNLGGGWLRAEGAQSVDHWVEHLLAPVRFAECVDTLRGLGADAADELVLLEVGPGAVLGSWARQQGAKRVASTLRHAEQPGSDRAVLLGALGQLWGWGVPVDWARQGSAEGRRRVVLPGHPLSRKRFWLDAPAGAALDGSAGAAWGRAAAPDPTAAETLAGRRVVVFGGADTAGFTERLAAAGAETVRVEAGSEFRDGGGVVAVRPASPDDFARLADALRARGWDAALLTAYLWPLEEAAETGLAALDEGLDRGLRGLLRWVRAAAGAGLLGEESALLAATRAAGAEAGRPWQAMLGGVLDAVAREHPGVRTRGVDVPASGWEDALLGEAARLAGEAGGQALHPRPALEAAYVAPRSGLERAVAELFGRALGIGRVGMDDDFFELGGDSLMATQLLAALNERFRAELPLRALFEAPTPARLAAAIAGERAESEGGELLTVAPAERIPPRGGSGPAPLSFAQQRIWMQDRLDPGARLFHVPLVLRIRGELDPAALRRALDEVVRRHEVLRTVFELREDGPVQRVLPATGVPFAAEDLSGAPDAAEAALRRAHDETARPFDLGREPGFRALLLRAEAREHVLVLAMHHIVQDRWSSGILLDELAALYGAFARGEASPLPEPELQYADFAVWQRERLAGAALPPLLDFWKRHLEGAPEAVDLPADLPRGPDQSYLGGVRQVVVPAATVRGLRALAREGEGTLYMALLAAYALLLRRWAGQDDLVIGSNVGGRTRTETERLMGTFANTLALRVRPDGASTFRELFREVRETVLETHRHQELPFERLVEELAPTREAGRIPLVGVSLDLHRAPVFRQQVPGAEMESLPVEAGAAGVDLHWFLEEHAEHVEGALEYDARIFLPETAARLADAYLRLLADAAARPDAPLGALAPLSPAERARVLEEWNDTSRDYPHGACVHDLFRAQAERTPDAVALVHRGRRLSYAELERRANRLAHLLRGRGVGPESRVGVCLPRAPELVVALLGVLKAGGAYVPLDPAYPRDRLAAMTEDAEVALVLATAELAERLPAGVQPLLLDEAEGDLARASDTAPETGTDPENLSHVIFTSGSTGRPKGVMIRHSSVVVLLHWLRESLSDEERSSVLFSTSISFDVSVEEVFGTLCWGGKLVLVENALELGRLPEGEQVVYASMVPTAAAELLRSGGIPASLRTLNLGGEPLPTDLARGLYALGTLERLGNMYGPTEDTTCSTYALVARDAAQVTIGRPVANTRAYVLDAALEPVPAGAVGELYLAGDGLARGYAGHPELTAERFLPDPFGAPGSRMYQVMDRVRWRPDGEMEYFGRTDFQVKVRGFRIELGEVEAALRAHPDVREAVATVREDAPGERRIVAYLVPREGVDAGSAQGLRAWLRGQLPEYMLPSAFVALDALPRTGSGKLDRRALPAPADDGPRRELVAPRTPMEERVAAAFAEVLGVGRVGVLDDFFELGGHSLLATRIAARLGHELGVEVPLRLVFDAPTAAGVAAWLESAHPPLEMESWELDEALARMEELSDEEVARLLGRQ